MRPQRRGRGGLPAPTAAFESLEPRMGTAHFEIHAGLASEDTVAAIASGLEARIAEMERYFGHRYNATGYVTGPSVI